MPTSLVSAARDALETLEVLSPLGPDDPVVMALHAAIEEAFVEASEEMALQAATAEASADALHEASRLRRVVRAMLASLAHDGRSAQEEVDLCELEGWEYIDAEISLEALRALAEIEAEEGS